jgi:predicted thioesterase
MVDVGATADIRFTANEAATAAALGSGDMAVLGTPKVVALCEEAAVAAVAGSLDDGSTTVGTAISINHRSPTAVGRTVVATAAVTSVDRRKLEFAVSVADGDLTVADGSHTRVIVDRERFLGRLDVP